MRVRYARHEHACLRPSRACHGRIAETRTCEQCGTVFAPRREHARFCRPRCRVAWNREHTGDPQGEASALEWSITAMREAIERLASNQVRDHAQGFAVISEAVWPVTIVGATLVRYHRHAYESAMKSRAPARRQAIGGTSAGLRFARNQMGYRLDPADFIQPEHGLHGADHRGVTAWRWRPVPEPDLGSLPLRGQARQEEIRQAAGSAWQDTDLVFPSRVGTPADASHVRRAFRKVVAAAGLDPHEWTPRELRHSFVSLLSDADVPIEHISRLVGHSSATTTETVYRKQIRPVIVHGADVMDRIFPSEANPGA